MATMAMRSPFLASRPPLRRAQQQRRVGRDGGFASPERARRRRRMAQRGLSPSSQTRARRQAQRLRGVGVTDAQLMEGEALLEAVQRQLYQAAPARAAPAQPPAAAPRSAARSQSAATGGCAEAPPAAPRAAMRSRKPPPAPVVESEPISPEAWGFFAPEGDATVPLPDEETEPEAGYSSSDGSDSTGLGAPEPDARTAPARRRPKSVSGTRPSGLGASGRGSTFGRPATSEGVRTFGRPSTSEGVRTFGRPSTSEGCRTFGRPSTSDGPRRRQPEQGRRPVTVEGTRRSRSPSDGWSGHGDGASWFRAEQQAARREQAAEKEEQDRWKASFESSSSAAQRKRQEPWERRQAKRRADEERAERRVAAFRVKSAQRREASMNQSAMVRNPNLL